MPVYKITFFPPLTDHLLAKAVSTYEKSEAGRVNIKTAIESLGVPHPEVGEIKVNGQPRQLDWVVQDGDVIEVYPFDFASLTETMEGGLRFVLDVHLGKLARYLRMLGYDALYWNDAQDVALADCAQNESRVLLTRDRQLLMRRQVKHGYWVRSLIPAGQLEEIRRLFGLEATDLAFKRCMECNTLLSPVEKEAVLERLEPLTRQYFNEFWICPVCQKVYWAGSHQERMNQILANSWKNSDDPA